MSDARLAPPPWGEPVRANDWDRFAGRPHTGRSVSVIVLHHRQPRELARTLAALAAQAGDAVGSGPEVIVVDDGSPEPPVVPSGVRLLRLPRRGARRSAGRNAGAAAASGDILVFLDADTTPEPDCITELTRLPSLTAEAVTVGRRRHADLSQVPVDVPVRSAGPAHELASPAWLARGYRDTGDLRRPGPTGFRFLISAVLAMSRWCFEAIGGFDERFDAYGGEDWELGFRAWHAGALLAHVPTAVAWHDGPDWAGRHDASAPERRRQKNAEARRLAGLLTSDGHRPRGLLGRRAEQLVLLPDGLDVDARFVTVDSLAAALPRAAFVGASDLQVDVGPDRRLLDLGSGTAGWPEWPTVRILVRAGVEVRGAGLAERCDALLTTDGGRVELGDDVGVLLVLETARHHARSARWGASGTWPEEGERPDWLRRLPDPCDVEAYLGGWRR